MEKLLNSANVSHGSKIAEKHAFVTCISVRARLTMGIHTSRERGFRSQRRNWMTPTRKSSVDVSTCQWRAIIHPLQLSESDWSLADSTEDTASALPQEFMQAKVTLNVHLNLRKTSHIHFPTERD